MFYDSNSFPGPRIVPIRRVAGARAPLVVKLDACVATPDTAAAHQVPQAHAIAHGVDLCHVRALQQQL